MPSKTSDKRYKVDNSDDIDKVNHAMVTKNNNKIGHENKYKTFAQLLQI